MRVNKFNNKEKIMTNTSIPSSKFSGSKKFSYNSKMLQQKTSSTGITNTYRTSSNTKPNISPTNFETKTINSKIVQNNLEQERSYYKSNYDLDSYLIRELTKSKSKSPNAQHNCNNSVGRTEHLKEKLENDILNFFDKHRSSALLIGNSRYKDKTAEYYLQNFEKGGVINEELLLQNYVEKPPVNNLKSQKSKEKFSYLNNYKSYYGIDPSKLSKDTSDTKLYFNDLSPKENKMNKINSYAKKFNIRDVQNQNIIIFEQNIKQVQNPIEPVNSYQHFDRVKPQPFQKTKSSSMHFEPSNIISLDMNQINFSNQTNHSQFTNPSPSYIKHSVSTIKTNKNNVKSYEGVSINKQTGESNSTSKNYLKSKEHLDVSPKPSRDVKYFNENIHQDLKQNVMNNFTVNSQKENELIYKKAIDKILEKSHKNIDLTPIPVKKTVKNKVEKQNYLEAERTAVLLRKIEYSENLKTWKSDLIKEYSGNLFSELMIEANIIRIQRWWRMMMNFLFRKNPKIVKIQSAFRGYLYRLFCLDRIKSLIRLSQLDYYFKIRNAKICLGILAVNFAKLFKQNFLKDNANKIISLFRKFRIKKRRLMSRFVDILMKKFLELTVIPSFKRVREYDGLKIASNCIKRNLKKYVEQIKLQKKVLNQNIDNEDYNPLVALYLNSKNKGGFQTYRNKKRFILGFVISQFKALLRKHRIKIFAFKVKEAIQIANSLLYNKYFFNKIKDYVYFKLVLDVRSNKLRSIFYVYFKTEFHNKFIKFRRNAYKLKQYCNNTINFVKILKRKYIFNPIIQKFKNVKKALKLSKVFELLFFQIKAKIFLAIKKKSTIHLKKINDIKKLIFKKSTGILKLYFKMWMKKSSCVIHIGKLFKNISIAFDILNNVFFFFRKKSFLELIKGLKNKQNFHKFLKLLEDFNYNSKKNCFSQLKKNKELKEEILLTKAFLIKKLFKKCSVLSKIKLKDYFTKFRNNINIKSKELSKNNYKARLFYYIITNVINTNKQAKFSFILSNLNKYVQSKIKFQVFCMVLVNKLSKSQENYKAFFLKTLLSNSVNFFCKSSLNKSLKQFIFKREEFLKNKLHKGFNTFANNIKKIIESNNKEIISNKLFISLNNKVNNYNKSKLAKLFNLWKRNLIENKVLLKINLIRSKFLKYLGLIKKQNIKKIANKLKIKYLVTNLKNTMNKTNKKIKSTDKIIRILSKKIDPLKKYFIFYIKINYFVKRISFTLTKNINNNKAYAINKFKAFEKNYLQKVVSIQSLIRKNIAKKLKQNKQNQNNAIIKLLKTKLLLLSRKVDISFIKWKNIVILLELNKKANLIKSFVKKSNALKRKFLIRKVSKKLLYSHIKNIQSKICKWRCIALSMKFINLIIKLQKMTRVYLFYNKAKQRTMNLVHKNWTCYLDNMKGMKKNLKMLVIILKRFALELSFYKILLKANTDSKKEAIQRLVKVLNFKLRVLLHSSFRDYKGLFEVANEKLFTFLNKEINPSFKKKLLNSVLNKFINQKDIKIQTMQSIKMFSFIHRKIKLSNSKKILLIQSFFRGYNLKNKLIKKIISFNKLKNMFTGNCIDFSKNTQITKIFKYRISKNQSKSNIYTFSGLSVGVVFLKKSLFKGKNNLLLIRALLASMFNWKIFLEKIEYVGNENLLFKQILKFTNLTTKYIRKRVISIFKQINIKKSLENQNNKKLNEELFRKKTATLNNLIISNIINKKLLLAKSFNQFKKFSIGIKIFNASLIVHRFMTNNWKKSKLKKLFTKYYKMKLLSFPKKLR